MLNLITSLVNNLSGKCDSIDLPVVKDTKLRLAVTFSLSVLDLSMIHWPRDYRDIDQTREISRYFILKYREDGNMN